MTEPKSRSKPIAPPPTEAGTVPIVEPQTEAASRIVIDASWPSNWAVARIVAVGLLLIFVANHVQSIISSIKSLFFLVVLSVFFAYLLDPLVKMVRQPFKTRNIERFMPRSLAIVIAYVIVFTTLGIVISVVAPRVAQQAKDFAENIPAYGKMLESRVDDLSHRFDRLRIPEDVQADITKKASELAGYISTEVGGIVLLSVTFIPWLLLIPILAFFFLKDVNLVRLAVLRAFPAGPYRMRAEAVLQDLNTTLAAYTRAQLTSCVVIGIICLVGFYALGLKYALLLGILAGTFEFVPLIGPALIGLIVILTAAFSDDPWKALYAAIFLLILRLIQDYVLYPRIVRGGIHLHPLVIILSVLAGEQIAGIPGVFLSIPTVAIASVIYRHVLDHRGGRSLVTSLIEESEQHSQEAA